MALVPGTDYLFFTKVDMSKMSLTAAMARGCAVCTPDAIYFAPVQSYGSFIAATVTTTYALAGGDPVESIGALLAREDLTQDGLRETLTALLSKDKTRWVFPLADAEKVAMKTGFFGMTTLKMPGEMVRRMVIRDKGGKKEAKAFYDALAS